MQIKVCYSCGEKLPIERFNKKSFVNKAGNMYRGHDHRCKPCQYEQVAVTKYLNRGFASLRTSYCECCGISEDETPIMIDHDHDTNHFRGFVCKSCNRRLGFLGDTFESIMESDCDKMYKDYMKIARLRSGKGLRA